jgi:hypothetical protein
MAWKPAVETTSVPVKEDMVRRIEEALEERKRQRRTGSQAPGSDLQERRRQPGRRDKDLPLMPVDCRPGQSPPSL